jgi:hypothetical protein
VVSEETLVLARMQFDEAECAENRAFDLYISSTDRRELRDLYRLWQEAGEVRRLRWSRLMDLYREN